MGSPVGVMIATSTPPEQIAPLAAAAELFGFSEVWVAEDYFQYGGFTAAALALGATESVRVGLGIIASVVRHPAVTAQEIATLAGAYPGRFLPGVGHGVPFWTGQMGLTPKSPLTSLTEAVSAVQDLLAGKTVDRQGTYFTFDGVTLAHPPAEAPPILTGVLGPKSLQLSGRIADGTVVSVLGGARYLESALADIRSGMQAGGRTRHLVPTFALFSIATDAAKARAAVRAPLAGYLAAVGANNALTNPYGYRDQIESLLSLGVERAARELPEEWIDTLTVAGDPDQVTARIHELLDAGATSVILSPVNAASAQDELALVSEAVLPRLV